MTRTIGFVPVQVGRAVVPVTVEAERGASTHYEVSATGAKIIVAENLTPDVATREVEAVLPEVERLLSKKMLN
jgi:hypothetical protein